MAGPDRAVRRVALAAIARFLDGPPLSAGESAAVMRDLDLLGFRKAAWGLLLKRRAAAALQDGGMTILARALGGRFVVACSGDDSGVGWEILEHGTYEPHVVAFYQRNVRPGMTVLDVGANIGFHALHAASLVGSEGRVIAVEPDPRNAGLLRLALAQNSGFRLEVIEAALSDRDGEVILSDLGNPSNSGARFVHENQAVLDGLVHGPAPRFRNVPAFAWDSRYLATPIQFVKMDVEGFEPRVARGMERALAQHRPTVLSEFAPSNLRNLGGTEPAAYLQWFRERGYRCSVLVEPSGATEPADAARLAARLGTAHHVDVVFEPE